MAAALCWLDQHPGWFLILDNVDTPEAADAAETMLARLRGGHVLITSRLTQWSGSVEPLELDVLASTDAAQFLLERTGRSRRKLASDQTDAAELARELDGLALALEQAAACIAQRHISLSGYLRDWRAHLPAVQEWYNPQLTKYPRSVAVTWETTLAQLHAGEIALLRIFAQLASDPIPLFVIEGERAQKLWQEGIDLLQQEVRASAGTGDEIFDALAMLANFSMVKWDTEKHTATVHRVVQEILRKRLPEAWRKAWLSLGLRLLDEARPGDPMDVRTWPRWNPLRPHVAVTTVQADQAGVLEPIAELMNALGLLLLAKALHAEAEPLMRRALTIDEQSFGPDHPKVAIRLNNLARLLQATNRLAEAEPLMRRALVIFARSFGVHHPNTEGLAANYWHMLTQLGQHPDQILARLKELVREF